MDNGSTSTSVARWTPVQCESAVTVSSASKILQSESRFAMLFGCAGNCFSITGEVWCNLQLLERCTAKCLFAAQSALSSVTPFSGRFKHALRLATTDEHASNLPCENSISKSMSQNNRAAALHKGCKVHVVFRIHKRVFAPCEKHVTGLLRHALSLDTSAHMNLFRRQ